MNIQKLISIKPSENQIAWQVLGFTAFLHYGINTFTNREWGDGKECPSQYNPSSLDTDQWCAVMQEAGIKACIITAKHHDGFCLFDTEHTNHSVMHSPKPVDVVAALSKSCEKYGLKLGVYLSPWDRHEITYGTGKAYDDFFCAQLEELTTRYGPLYSLWFDGACGEGPNGKTQIYDWQRYYAVIRKNQPQAVIAVCGPDVRWIGNEAGHTRQSEWSVVPARLRTAESTAKLSQQSDDAAFRERPIRSEDADLGSRQFLAQETELCWYPAEVNVSIRPGWFYHAEENNKVRGLENLLDIYEKSVGGNALLLLNIPPDTAGQINCADFARLKELGERVKKIYSHNILENAHADCENILRDDECFWTGGAEQDEINIILPAPKEISRVVLCEQIRESQRVEEFEILAEANGKWRTIYRGTTIGFKKICVLETCTVEKLRIAITQSRVAPTLRFVGVY